MKDMGKRMLEKFLKYWSDFCTILTIAVIFYPRYKLQFVEWAYKKVYGENSNELKKILERSCFHCLMNICSFRPNLPIHLPCKVLFLTQMRMMTEKAKENWIHVLRLVLFIYIDIFNHNLFLFTS